MNLKEFGMKVEASDNDSLLRSLIEHAKKMEDDLTNYEAVKLIKTELLERLEGDFEEPKKWREQLTDEEFLKAVEMYENGISISEIRKSLDEENLSLKAVRLAIAGKYGIAEKCEYCKEVTDHVAFKRNDKASCIRCGRITR